MGKYAKEGTQQNSYARDHNEILTGGRESGQTFAIIFESQIPAALSSRAKRRTPIPCKLSAGSRGPSTPRPLRFAQWPLHSGDNSFRILIPQLSLPIGHWNYASLDEDLLHIGFYVQRIAVRNHDVGAFTHIERSELVGDAPDLGCVQGDCLECFVVGEAESGCESGLIGQVAHVVR